MGLFLVSHVHFDTYKRQKQATLCEKYHELSVAAENYFAHTSTALGTTVLCTQYENMQSHLEKTGAMDSITVNKVGYTVKLKQDSFEES